MKDMKLRNDIAEFPEQRFLEVGIRDERRGEEGVK